MATPERKPFCVLQFAKRESVISVHCGSCLKLNCDPPGAKISADSTENSKRQDVFVKGKRTGRPELFVHDVARIYQ